MLGLADGSGFDLAHDDTELSVGIRGDLIEPLILDLEGRILEHGHELLVEHLDDLILLLDRGVGIADHHQCQVLIILLNHTIGDDIGHIVDNAGDVAPLGDGSVAVVDDIIHAALDASGKAESAAHVAVELIIGSIVDQRKLGLVQRSDNCHTLESGACQILVVNIDNEQVAVDLIIFLSGDADDAGSSLAHSISVDV